MKHFSCIVILCLSLATSLVNAQSVDSIRFFTDDHPIDLTLTTDIRTLQNEKKLNVFQPATVVVRFPDSTVITEDIKVGARGHYRRDNCVVPPLWLNFRSTNASKLNNLGKLKLVIGCGTASDDEQLILKEYLTYKIYNLLDQKSYRARLVKVNYQDTRKKLKAFSQYAFILEDDKDMAKRNKCVKKPDVLVMTENTHRATMTKVAIFEYMISNGDWSVPHFHNIHVIYAKGDDKIPPYPVPYDFDHSGLVNAGYALPPEMFGTETVRERVYRGFPRTMEELEETLDIFRKKKDDIYKLISDFPYMKEKVKKDMTGYLDEFFTMINNKKQVSSVFIDNARKD